MFGHSLSGVFVAILLACSVSDSSAPRKGRNSAVNGEFVRDNLCGQQVNGSPGFGMQQIGVVEREVQFCFRECERLPGCTVYSSEDARLGVRSIFALGR